MASPFVYTGVYGLSPVAFSAYFAVNALGFVLAAGGGGALVERIGAEGALRVGLLITAAAGLGLAGLASLSEVPFPAVVGLLFCLTFGLGLIIPTTMVLTLEPFDADSGLAASLAGAAQMIVGALVAGASGLVFDGSVLHLAIALALCGAAALITNGFRQRA